MLIVNREMAEAVQHQATLLIIEISPDALQNKNKKSAIIKETCSAVCGLLNSHYGGNLKLTSTQSLSPSLLDELVRGIEQTLIDFLGLTSLREFCRTEITGHGKEILFTVMSSDRICTVEYNLYLPTDFLVRQVLRTEPLVNIARLLKTGPFVNLSIQTYEKEFQQDSIVPGDLRESDSVQFKKIKSDRNKNKSLADRIIANKITHYIAAFANHKGGHVYIGIDDETYKVCGQNVNEEEKGRVVEKLGSAIKNMVWPEEHGEPQLGKHWNIFFVPVVDSNKVEIPGLFVIAIAVACCPGGVFLSHPESYVIKNRKVVRMGFKQWKKRVLHDAHMRDIVKICRENSWQEKKALPQSPQDKGISKRNLELPGNFCGTENSPECSNPRECTNSLPRTMSRVAPRNTKSRNFCQRITDIMERMIQDGDFGKVQTFASKTCYKSKAFHKPDIEVAVRLMLALGAYRRRSFEEAYQELGKASALITSTENSVEFELQRIHLLACFCRGEGQYAKSYEVTCGGLQEIEGISPGWHSAWMLSDAGYLFSVLAGEERNEEICLSLEQQAVKLYTQAIQHTTKFGEEYYWNDAASKVSTSKSNLLHRCHIRRAMLSLRCAPLAEENDEFRVVTSEALDEAIVSILVVEESALRGESLTKVNECYLFLVKSDLNYRRSQINATSCEQYHREAVEWAIKASTLAKNEQFHGIFKYAKSRLDRLSSVRCASSVEEDLLTELEGCKEYD